MRKIESLLFLLIVSLPVYAGRDSLFITAKRGVFASYSLGWTQYKAKDLNDVMLALEQQSSEAAGLNHYDVDQFNGHPRQAVLIGAFWRQWYLGVELEFWVENFSQDDVPFYMNRDMDPRFPPEIDMNCQQILVPDFAPVAGGTAGCIDAQEIFTIVPLTFQLSRRFDFWNGRLWAGLGAGAGVLAGDARLIVKTNFVGQNARPDDRMEITLYPGINPVYKAFVESGWRPFTFVGFSLKGGYRWSGMEYVEISEKQGDSFLFGLVLGQESHLEKGNRAYLIRTPNNQSNVLVLRDKPTAAEERQARLAGSRYDLVSGDFSGWMLEAKIDFWIGL